MNCYHYWYFQGGHIYNKYFRIFIQYYFNKVVLINQLNSLGYKHGLYSDVNPLGKSSSYPFKVNVYVAKKKKGIFNTISILVLANKKGFSKNLIYSNLSITENLAMNIL